MSGFKQMTIFTPNTTSVEILEEVRDMWATYELGNDTSYLRWYTDMDEDYPETAKYIRENNVDESNLLIHWWW